MCFHCVPDYGLPLGSGGVSGQPIHILDNRQHITAYVSLNEHSVSICRRILYTGLMFSLGGTSESITPSILSINSI